MRFRLYLLLVLACCLTARAADKKEPVQLPVTSVTLFAGGSAYVEHRGVVRDDGVFELRVKPSQLAGVLKTLVVQDGPSAEPAVSIEPVNPPTTQGAEPKVDLGSNPTLVEMLQKLRGSKIRLSIMGGELEATVLSLEKSGGDGLESWQLNVLAGTTLRTVPMSDVQRFELADPRAKEDLARAIESIWQNPDDVRRTINVNLRAAGERTVKIGYTVDAQAWKASYKLILGAKPTIQGWATVVNESDQPWNNIQLNLVSHQPLIGGALDAGTVSRAAKGTNVPVGESFRKPKAVVSRDALDNAPDAAPSPRRAAIDLKPPIDPKALFRQAASNVTVAPKGTLLVPLFNQNADVERVAVFNEALLKRNALQGAILRNGNNSYLMQGPVTLMDEGEYAGEGAIENLVPGRWTLVAWGIDLGVIVDASRETHTLQFESASIVSGVVNVERTHVLTRQYVIDNESRTERRVVVEHPVRRGWKLIEPAQAQILESTETVYRLPLSVKGGASGTVMVKEQSAEGEAIELASAAPETLTELAREKTIAPAVARALEEAMKIRGALMRKEQEAQESVAKLDRLAAEQARVRENLKALSETDAARTRQTEKLEALDKQLTELREAIDAQAKTLMDARDAAAKALGEISAK